MKSERRPIHCHRDALRGLLLAATLLFCSPFGAAQTPLLSTPEPIPETSLRLRVRPLPQGARKVRLVTDSQGGHWYVLEKLDGSEENLTPDEFASRLDHDHRSRQRLHAFLNITSPIGVAWVVLGLAGQVLFAGRMIVQWVASERRQRSVIPVAFWWMSLGGASMLLAYFIWRRDIVGVLGQGAGWAIYCRNLFLIAKNRAPRSE